MAKTTMVAIRAIPDDGALNRYFDGDKWCVGAYPKYREDEAKGFTRNPKNSWSYWFKKD